MSLTLKYKSLERFNFQKTLEDIRRKECEKEKCVAPMDSMGAYTRYGYKWYWDNGFNSSRAFCGSKRNVERKAERRIFL